MLVAQIDYERAFADLLDELVAGQGGGRRAYDYRVGIAPSAKSADLPRRDERLLIGTWASGLCFV